MKKTLVKKLNNLTLGQLFDVTQELESSVWTYEDLHDFAIDQVKDDSLNVAIHILNALYDTQEAYYNYDATMGTLEEITPITTKEDLLKILKNYYDEYIEEVLKNYEGA